MKTITALRDHVLYRPLNAYKRVQKAVLSKQICIWKTTLDKFVNATFINHQPCAQKVTVHRVGKLTYIV